MIIPFRTLLSNMKFHSNARIVYKWFSVISCILSVFFGLLGSYGIMKISIFGEPGVWMILGVAISVFYLCFAFICLGLAIRGWFDITSN